MNVFEKQETADGSITFYSAEFEQAFHSRYGAKKEAEITYIKGCKLREKAKFKSSLKIIDICYGLGYNTAAALESIWKINPHCKIELIALEIDERVPFQAINNLLLNLWSEPIPSLLIELAHNKSVLTNLLKATLFLEDARISIKKVIENNFKADAIFLDPFSPPKCPQLWTVEFLNLVAKCLNQDGIIATYSCSASVRSTLKLVGLKIGKNDSVGRKSSGTIACFKEEYLTPLLLLGVTH
jgi:tRNA U34 5-methylaminomethyl-2-thiouridine-forming methyltransferase MnmC